LSLGMAQDVPQINDTLSKKPSNVCIGATRIIYIDNHDML